MLKKRCDGVGVEANVMDVAAVRALQARPETPRQRTRMRRDSPMLSPSKMTRHAARMAPRTEAPQLRAIA